MYISVTLMGGTLIRIYKQNYFVQFVEKMTKKNHMEEMYT